MSLQQSSEELGDFQVGPLWAEAMLASPRRVTISEALGWFDGGAGLMRGNWWLLISALLVMLLLNLVTGFFPLAGGILTLLMTPVFYAGLVSVLHFSKRHGKRAPWWRALDGINHRFMALAALPVMQCLAFFLCFATVIILDYLLGVDTIEAFRTRSVGIAEYVMMAFLLLSLVVANLAFFFYVPLVFLGDLSLREAVVTSWKACRANLLPLICYQLMVAVLLALGVVFAGVGLLYAVPLIIASNYFGFRQVCMADRG